jgi:hypothetical protein
MSCTSATVAPDSVTAIGCEASANPSARMVIV